MTRVLALALLLPLLAGCGGLPSTGVSAGRPVVVASFYPLEYVVHALTDEPVTDLTVPGVEPHDVELSVRQVAEVSRADLVVYESGLQPSVDQAVANNARNRSLDVVPTARLERRDGSTDPHFWLDPVRLSAVAAAVARRLERIDPDHASTYAARLRSLQAALQTLDQHLVRDLVHCRVRTVVVNHEAFGYLERYGLDVVSVSGLTPDAEPSPAHLNDLRRLIRARGVTTLFSEPLASSKPTTTLAHDLGLRTATLDPLENHLQPRKDYLDVMYDDLAALREANHCGNER